MIWGTEMTVYDMDLSNYGELMTVGEFRKAVEFGSFIDYDGYGHPVRDGKMSQELVCPSQVMLLPEDATHVIWFNK